MMFRTLSHCLNFELLQENEKMNVEANSIPPDLMTTTPVDMDKPDPTDMSRTDQVDYSHTIHKW